MLFWDPRNAAAEKHIKTPDLMELTLYHGGDRQYSRDGEEECVCEHGYVPVGKGKFHISSRLVGQSLPQRARAEQRPEGRKG